MIEKKNEILSVIVPVYNQERTIERNLRAILLEAESLKIATEILVVIDGLSDRSFDRAKKVKSPILRILGYQNNKGKGHAVRFGMARAKGNIIAFLDAGGDIQESGLSMLYEHMKWYNADIIVGSKRHTASKLTYPIWRRIMSVGYQILLRLLFGLNITDTQAGIKMYRRKVLEDVMPRLLVKRFAFDIEILAVSKHLGYNRIFEAPIEVRYSKLSSITSKNFWKIILASLWDTTAIWYRLRIKKYYDTLNKHKWIYDPELNFKINID